MATKMAGNPKTGAPGGGFSAGAKLRSPISAFRGAEKMMHGTALSWGKGKYIHILVPGGAAAPPRENMFLLSSKNMNNK